MSKVARWSYTNTATVWKRGDSNVFGGGSEWLEPFTIKCTWIAGGKVATDNGGIEFVATCQFFHEDARVEYGDMIAKGDMTASALPVEGAREIRGHTEWDMTPFKDPMPDYRSSI